MNCSPSWRNSPRARTAINASPKRVRRETRRPSASTPDRNQMRRLFRCQVELIYQDEHGERSVASRIADGTALWWNASPTSLRYGRARSSLARSSFARSSPPGPARHEHPEGHGAGAARPRPVPVAHLPHVLCASCRRSNARGGTCTTRRSRGCWCSLPRRPRSRRRHCASWTPGKLLVAPPMAISGLTLGSSRAYVSSLPRRPSGNFSSGCSSDAQSFLPKVSSIA